MKRLAKSVPSFLGGLICVGFAISTLSSTNKKVSPSVALITAPQIADTCSKIKIREITKLEWDKPLPLTSEMKSVDLIASSSGGMIAVDYRTTSGPKRYLLRPTLVPHTGLSTVLGQFRGTVSENNIVIPGAVPKVIGLAAKVYDIHPAGNQDVWALVRGKLVRYTFDGTVVESLPNPGATSIVQANEGFIWLLGDKHAWVINSKRQMRGSWQWNGGQLVVGKAICRLERPLADVERHHGNSGRTNIPSR
jgi:hypothetical protein